jgi:uncharacterized membrane protein (UPF0127 family)
MVFFGTPEGLGRHDLGDDGPGESRLRVITRGFRFGFLLRRMEEDGRAVLVADVRPLAVQRGWVVIIPENLEQVVIADDFGIESDFDHFGVARAIGTDVFIGRVIQLASGIADRRGFDARQTPERGFDAPKTACPERGLLHAFIIMGCLKLRVRNLTKNTLLADRADIADTSATRQRGLLKHSGLAEGEGLWIVPCEGVHSFFMKFAIDVVFINKKRVVTKMRPNMVKSRIALSLRAHSTLELPVGMIQKSQTAVGDQLDLERYEP